MTLRRVPARRAVIAPARRAAFEVVRRVFEDDAYADRALAARGRRASTTATARSRSGSRTARCSARARSTSASSSSASGPCASSTRPCARRSASARYQLAFTDLPEHAVVDDAVELVRAARRERAVPFTNAVMRRLAQGFRGLVASLPDGPLKDSYPDWIAEIWARDFGAEEALVADARAERAAGARGARGRAGRRARPTSRAHTRRSRRSVSGCGPMSRGVAARGARRRLAGRRADPRRVRGARRQDADAARAR